MVHKAESEPDPVARGILETDGPRQQERWSCPKVTDRPPDPDALDEKCREVLKATETLTGVRCQTCPNFYPRLPWVHEARAAWHWRDKGSLRERVGYASTVLVRAIDLIDRGDGMRARDDIDRAKREREAEADKAKRAREDG